MLYLWPATSNTPTDKGFGVMARPNNQMIAPAIKMGLPWAYDNQCFTDGFHYDVWARMLAKLKPYRATCLFVVAPDVVGDAKATLALWDQWLWALQGWPTAFVCQDGQEHLSWPGTADWIFIGGTNRFKMGPGGKDCIARAHTHGQPVHVGRVNSITRFRYFQKLGCYSCDGTFPVYEPSTAYRRLKGCVSQPMLPMGKGGTSET